jgi:two-component system, NtrC family, sensor kinase
MTRRSWQIVLERVRSYHVPLLFGLYAVVLELTCGIVYSMGAAALAVCSFLHTRRLLGKLQNCDNQREEAHEKACRAQVFTSVDQLSAGIGHEINNPLGIIAQETQWLEHILETPQAKDIVEVADCRDSLREIAAQVDRCKEIVQKLLGLARQMEPVMQLADVNDLVREMVALVDREASQKKIRLVSSLQEPLPMVATDPPLLRQVLLNLMVNATHAIESDGLIEVSTSTSDGREVTIVVHDTGCGIAKENLPKIFIPFFSTKAEGKGSGLGLALCRGIIERLGGKISVTSELGRCTTFTLHLPLNK